MTGMLPAAIAEWLPHQRWYAGRHREIETVRPEAVTRLAEDLEHMLLDVTYADGGSERYQVFVRFDQAPHGEFATVAHLGSDGARVAYDALYDEDAARQILALIDADTDVDGLRFVREPGARLPVDAPARVGDAEQSNTSVVFDSAALLKVFRRVLPGLNPDLELNRVLARAGCPHVAQLLGAIESTDAQGQPLSLGMVSAYAQNSAEGWAMATASARDLLAETDLHADEVGGDFSAESFRLGAACAAVHQTLAVELGAATEPVPVETMSARLDAAVRAVPELAEHLPAIRETLRDAAGQEVTVQRIHGDLHLGQVLRTPTGWLLIDFEGEPGRPIAERRQPDSPLRDVAGMLRSYEYAAYQLLVGLADDDKGAEKLAERAREWIDRNQDAFCAGYTEVTGFDPRAHGPVLCAYELDKMMYEAAYEARHRPGWLRIPLKSVARLLG